MAITPHDKMGLEKQLKSTERPKFNLPCPIKSRGGSIFGASCNESNKKERKVTIKVSMEGSLKAEEI